MLVLTSIEFDEIFRPELQPLLFTLNILLTSCIEKICIHILLTRYYCYVAMPLLGVVVECSFPNLLLCNFHALLLLVCKKHEPIDRKYVHFD